MANNVTWQNLSHKRAVAEVLWPILEIITEIITD